MGHSGRMARRWREAVHSRHVLAAVRFERQPNNEDTERKHMDSNLIPAAFYYEREGTKRVLRNRLLEIGRCSGPEPGSCLAVSVRLKYPSPACCGLAALISLMFFC